MRVQGKRIKVREVGPDFSGPTYALIPDAEDVGGTGGVVRLWLTFGESSSGRRKKQCRWCSKKISFRLNNVDHVSRLCLGNVASPKVSQIPVQKRSVFRLIYQLGSTSFFGWRERAFLSQ